MRKQSIDSRILEIFTDLLDDPSNVTIDCKLVGLGLKLDELKLAFDALELMFGYPCVISLGSVTIRDVITFYKGK
jgi:hypothetical protein